MTKIKIQMKGFYYFSILLMMLILACQQSNTTKTEDSEKKQVLSTDTIRKEKLAVGPIKLDSLDRANNESVLASGNNITKAYVYLKGADSTINLTANIKRDHRFFGYSEPNLKSERLILFSIFTNDVKDNPFGCKLGAYYETSGLQSIALKYNATIGDFIKATATDKLNNATTIYFEKKWIEFE
jgi:hypothetical protein